MFESTFLITIALGYVGALFAVAWIGDRLVWRRGGGRPLIYALSISVYCTSWTFFGSVGVASTTGYDFLPVYIGPVLMFAVGAPLIRRIVELSKRQNLTSAADFMAARYGKSQRVAAMVTIVMVIGTLPYIALQLKAIAVSVETLLGNSTLLPSGTMFGGLDEAVLITLALAAFAILFGTRHADATEHQDGLMLAIALEGVVKLTAFIAVGVFVVWWMFAGPADFLAKAAQNPSVQATFSATPSGGKWLTITLLSLVCILLLPRQFHVTVVENNDPAEIARARWLFPLYLVAINLFVIPLAIAGLILLPNSSADPDFFVLALPLEGQSRTLSLVAFVGGLSAATAMVIVEAIALSIMVSNGLVLPWLLRRKLEAGGSEANSGANSDDMTGVVLAVRRWAIVIILMLAYGVYAALASAHSLVGIGLISFAAIAQAAPAFFGGLVWRNGTARGAISGMAVGVAVWGYTLLLPWIARAGFLPVSVVTDGPFGIAPLRPEALLFLQFDPLAHGVFWSLTANMTAYVVVSLLKAPMPIERLQALIFIPDSGADRNTVRKPFSLWRTSLTIGDLEKAAARYLGPERAAVSFSAFRARRNATSAKVGQDAEADVHAIRFTEHLLTSAVGAASSRLVLSLLLRKGNVAEGNALRLLDDASEALQFNRDLLQSALDQVRHGLAVFDRDMRLMCWNRPFGELMNLPDEVVQLGAGLDTLLRVSAGRAGLEAPAIEAVIGERMTKLALNQEIYHERELSVDRILEVRTSPMPQGGIVVTFSDITHRVLSDAALARANETLERRVEERTLELVAVNTELEAAKAKAEGASQDKTRFIAAASHDILQPLNAARLYAASLVERELAPAERHLVGKLDASLVAVEEIFSALIEVSRIDAGRLEPEIDTFPLAPVLDQLKLEFEPIAAARGLSLTIVPTRGWVRSDRRMLRRVLQNLIQNAVKYTTSGGVLVGVRRRGNRFAIAVYDTGQGIAPENQSLIFQEFRRLSEAGPERGVGLGLSIVERISRMLDRPIVLKSELGRGSMFAIEIDRAQPADARPLVTATNLPALSMLGQRIVCLDNEPEVLAGMEALLREWGLSVETAGSAEAVTSRRIGFPRLRNLWPDLILADYHLDDGQTGLDAIAKVRAASGFEIPAVIITADHSTDVQRAIRNAGLVQLRKPVRPAALRAVLTQAAQAGKRAAAE